MCKVNINVASVFAKFESVNELKEVAQSIVNQVNNAYKERLAELMAEEKSDAVEVSVDEVEVVDEKPARKTKQSKKTNDATKDKTKKSAPTAKKGTEKPAKEEVKQVSISSLTKAQIKAMDLKFEKYSDKCMFLTGNTRCIKNEIMATGGAHWNGKRQGWFIKNDSAKEIAKALKIKIA